MVESGREEFREEQEITDGEGWRGSRGVGIAWIPRTSPGGREPLRNTPPLRAVAGAGWVDDGCAETREPIASPGVRSVGLRRPMPAVMLMPDWRELVGWIDLGDGAAVSPPQSLDLMGPARVAPAETAEQEPPAPPTVASYGEDPEELEEDTVKTVASGPERDAAPPGNDDTLDELAEWLEEDL